MFPKRLLISISGLLAVALAACTPGATPQLIGAYPRDGQGQPPAGGPLAPTLAITYHAALEIEVEYIHYAVADLQALAREQGGYLLNSITWSKDGDEYAEVTLAVPDSRFEVTRSRIRNMGEVTSESVSGEITSSDGYDGQPTFSNITVTLRPASARWSRRLLALAGSAGRMLLVLCPPSLMLIGLWTVIRWLGARLGPREEAG